MLSNQKVTVYGAYGHTGRFIVAELCTRGLTPVLSGRSLEKLEELGRAYPGLEIRPASVDDTASLDRALHGSAAVINAAGPFMLTSAPVIEAALRARIPYLDVAAEVEVAVAAFAQYTSRANDAGMVIVPSIAFYGGLGDLLATAAMGDWQAVDEISLAFALSSWRPTLGTRATSQTSRQRRGGQRLVFTDHRLQLRSDSAPIVDWTSPPPFGKQTVVADFVTADSVTIPGHVQTRQLHTYMMQAPLRDLADTDLSLPVSVDASGRSAQIFLLEARVRSGQQERRAVVSGQDIYAVSAPLVVEATQRVLDASFLQRGVLAAGQAFDASDFLRALSPRHLALELP
ncbi:saccharopine dehydrogenase NADP-binding domain-containing protein [Dyella silvatica]|uniref:saccharopine dehydrogenase NADP-binding domain-containing protein n=1 Tax=Dyella silvatica TaxID=2992128 RepID=UPI0022548AF2|nr:saccharopine dehydrogenase NADP-binding domain-containing protein [Dyella silvatica]